MRGVKQVYSENSKTANTLYIKLSHPSRAASLRRLSQIKLYKHVKHIYSPIPKKSSIITMRYTNCSVYFENGKMKLTLVLLAKILTVVSEIMSKVSDTCYKAF